MKMQNTRFKRAYYIIPSTVILLESCNPNPVRMRTLFSK